MEKIPEDCQLVACHTGEGWLLSVEDRAGKTVAYLAWPFGATIKSSAELQRCGFETV